MTAPVNRYPQRRRFKLLCVPALFACLTACGQIGPLYLPESTPPEQNSDATPPSSEASTEEQPDVKDKKKTL